MSVSVGVLSAAHGHANAYADAVSALDGAHLHGIADEDPDRGRAFADRHGVEYGGADAVLGEVDAAIVCAANVDHPAWIERAAGAGVDVLCEKPLATSVAAAETAVDVCAEAGVSLGVAMPVRFLEPVRRAKHAVASGDLGSIEAVVGTNLLTWMGPDDGWIVDPDRSGGGAIMDHTVHVVDLVRWITGREVTEVYAEAGTRFADVDVEDVNVLSMELEDGTPFTHEGSWRQPDAWDFWGDVTLRLIGTDAVLEVDCFDQTLRQTRSTGTEPGIESVYWGDDMNEGLVRDFVESVRAGRDPAITGVEAVREVRVVEAAYDSLSTGEPVTISH